MKEIVVIAPFSSMSEVTERVIEENSYTSVRLIEANMQNVLEKTRLAIKAGAKVIISRKCALYNKLLFSLNSTSFSFSLVKI